MFLYKKILNYNRMLSELKDDHDLKCNTVKDKTTLNHKTAGNNDECIHTCKSKYLSGLYILLINFVLFIGILMGAWPCGKIVMLGELYGSESLSQVYGQVHTLLQENTRELNGLRE